MIDGALWRQRRVEDDAAILAARLMSATGNFKSPVKPRQLLGRDLQSPDPLEDRRQEAVPISEKAQRGQAMIAMATLRRGAKAREP